MNWRLALKFATTLAAVLAIFETCRIVHAYEAFHSERKRDKDKWKQMHIDKR